jgi:hypothetical protein
MDWQTATGFTSGLPIRSMSDFPQGVSGQVPPGPKVTSGCYQFQCPTREAARFLSRTGSDGAWTAEPYKRIGRAGTGAEKTEPNFGTGAAKLELATSAVTVVIETVTRQRRHLLKRF